MKPGGETQAKAAPLIEARVAAEIGDDIDRPKPFAATPNPSIVRSHPDSRTRLSVPFGSGMGLDTDDTDHRLATEQAREMVNVQRRFRENRLDFISGGSGHDRVVGAGGANTSTASPPPPPPTNRPPSSLPAPPGHIQDIDFSIIEALEGGNHLNMYYPKGAGNLPHAQSGPTIGIGVDLGQMNRADLDDLVKHHGLDPAIASKLRPYLGLKGIASARFIRANPLQLKTWETLNLSYAKHGSIRQTVETNFNSVQAARGSSVRFAQLPRDIKTTILSVAAQYGGDLPAATPDFWRYVSNNNRSAMIAELRNFHDQHARRRNHEADYLELGIHPPLP